jgi:hypothetical protein
MAKKIRLTLIEGYHATQTERKAVAQMIEKGMVEGCTSKVKCYKITSQKEGEVKVELKTKRLKNDWFPSEGYVWDVNKVTFKVG